MQMHVGPRLSVVVLVCESESHGGDESIGQLLRTGKTEMWNRAEVRVAHIDSENGENDFASFHSFFSLDSCSNVSEQ